MSKTVSARLPDSKHDELRERCNQLGCTMTEWLVNAIDFCMQPEGSTDFDFGGDEEEDSEDDEPSDIEPEPITRKRPELDEDKYKPHYDSRGNYYTYNKDRQMWTCHLNTDNVRIK